MKLYMFSMLSLVAAAIMLVVTLRSPNGYRPQHAADSRNTYVPQWWHPDREQIDQDWINAVTQKRLPAKTLLERLDRQQDEAEQAMRDWVCARKAELLARREHRRIAAQKAPLLARRERRQQLSGWRWLDAPIGEVCAAFGPGRFCHD